ncbi:SafA/ExsA family spore coat assembly protein [Paenibacillus tarimensis]|uniref:SafA/ExsA family spore coat assembly protein n=1 Tax=Paenibacillus tarimensis TaxID=416012 RepID=UPI001F3E6B64|nr:SafA/ExsA family spore coat assembly protein [Paenibacillus tarimensis]MCF2945784.1 SafA/ExsA family spore coat assembly protein [Paenibacillus tarimensis]
MPRKEKKEMEPVKRISLLAMALFMLLTSVSNAATDTYIVQKGDSLWKIAVKYQIGVSEIISANPQFKNPNLIYPGDKVNIPNIDQTKNVEQQVLTIVNQERSKAGLRPLQMDWELQRTARVKSCDMAQKGFFSHQSPTYGSPFDMMRAFGISYRTAGENIAKGQRSPQEVMNSWMNSSGHRANILKAEFTHIGVGYCERGNHWTQMFIGK